MSAEPVRVTGEVTGQRPDAARVRRALVTGGGGFLGRGLVLRLLERGVEVTSLARGAYPELEARGARVLRGDLGERDVARRAAEGQELIFHVAALAGVWGPRAAYERANVLGTEHMLDAACEHGARVFVHTSSPSVVFDGESHHNAGQDLPYPTRFLAHYPETKARAEALVLARHGQPTARGHALATVALRPHLIFGPGDPHLVPRLLERADRGHLRIVGDGRNLVSLTYVDNAVEAHLAAADTLLSGPALGRSDGPGGKAYFVANEEPVRLWGWINSLLEATGRPPVTRRVPAGVAYAAGAVLEPLHRLLRRAGEPRMTRFVARQLSTTHTYDLEPLKRDTGYRERVPMAEAVRRTLAAMAPPDTAPLAPARNSS
ncbi:MAG: NAD-dependent epimerase/dehydratase family protein [Planctomycetota bacterium]